MTSLDPRRMNPTVRGFAIIVLVAALITALQLEPELALVFFLLRIAFIVVIAIFVFGLWRRHRGEISTWPVRARVVFYGAAALAIVDLGAAVVLRSWPSGGLEALVFFFVLAACGFAMWRVWRDEHSYGY